MKPTFPETPSKTSTTITFGLKKTHMQSWNPAIVLWVGICGDYLTGPYFLHKRLNGHNYRHILEEGLPGLMEVVPISVRNRLWFMHDGAPAYFSALAHEYLNQNYNNRWKGHGGPQSWPPRSPDLNALDYFPWGHLKSTPIHTEEQLRNRIIVCCETIRTTPTFQRVVGLARRKVRLDTLALKLSGKKGKLYPLKADISKEEDIINAFKWIKENVGPVHVLINNAGVFGDTDLGDGDIDIWRNVLNVNVLGLSIATREAIRDMRANNVDGHIIHINSVTGHQVPNMPKANMYPASKFAVRALAETLRLELLNLKLKIKVTNISPGLTDTEIVPDFIKAKIQETGGEQMIEPENIADGVVYALSTPPHVQIQELTIRCVNEYFLK
ncbi:farnesol dehydrogenase-like [Anoplophora glabripennis]|uniref:farnesol dehydrogenase-like n=1 Tax=Anoplophora glabripennis TaxID=217634 RepID=UPI00087488CA|nr:farnesol dehydrogenase-like [Anoplophora glabripennis]